MGGDFSKDINDAIRTNDAKKFSETMNKNPEDAAKLDIFKLIENPYDPDNEDNKLDLISLLISSNKTSNSSHSITPLLKLLHEQVKKNKNNKEHRFTIPQTENQQYGYLELLAANQSSDIDAFKYLLDNSEDLPLKSDLDRENNEYRQTSLLHDLAASSASVELLREYLASGRAPARFNNKNGEEARKLRNPHYHRYRLAINTPLQVACLHKNVDGVKELCAANYGGTNYDDCLFSLIVHCKKEEEDKAIEICLCLLTQPGSAEKIKNYFFNDSPRRCEIMKMSPLMGSHRNRLEIVGMVPLTESGKDDKIELHPITFPLLAAMFDMYKLHTTLITNGCKFYRGPYFSQTLYDKQMVLDMLQNKYHETIIDIDAVDKFEAKGWSPLMKACAEGDGHKAKILLEHGNPRVDMKDVDGKTAKDLAADAKSFKTELLEMLEQYKYKEVPVVELPVVEKSEDN